MKKTLNSISTIQTGVFAKPIDNGEVVYLQAKHFDENGKLIATLHPDLRAEGITEKHLLKYGDVLFASKGTKNFAACYKSNSLPAVASTSFFVIRLNSDMVSPEYIAWFINQQNSQKVLKGKAIGTSMVSISKEALVELEISIPSIETQKAILYITELRNTEKQIKQQLEILRENIIQQKIINAIK